MLDLQYISKLPDEALVSIETLALLTGQGKSTVWRKFHKEPHYPEPIHLGTRCTKVVLGQIRAYISLKAATGQKNLLVGKEKASATEKEYTAATNSQMGAA